jgi:hypothetical protein
VFVFAPDTTPRYQKLALNSTKVDQLALILHLLFSSIELYSTLPSSQNVYFWHRRFHNQPDAREYV